MKRLEDLVRKNVWALSPYSSARDEYSGKEAHIFLDANENPYNAPMNRYPDPLQREVKIRLAAIKGVQPNQVFLGNGSDEAIDLCYRVFCEPGRDNVVAIDPTYGMYKVCADINDVEYRRVSLDDHFGFSASQLLQSTDEHTKLIWLCTPNNPTGNNLDRNQVLQVLQSFQGIVVIDEAYGDFSSVKSYREQLAQYPNLIVLNTMSKAWGCAAIRLGMAFASEEIIGLFNKVKYPYNVNLLTQEAALTALKDPFRVRDWVNELIRERERTIKAFEQLPICKKIYPTDANFFLCQVADANGIYNYLVNEGIIVRNRTKVHLCQGCLRITIGTKRENIELIGALRRYC